MHVINHYMKTIKKIKEHKCLDVITQPSDLESDELLLRHEAILVTAKLTCISIRITVNYSNKIYLTFSDFPIQNHHPDMI